MTARFSADALIPMAQFCAELVRQGVGFDCVQLPSGDWVVKFTGAS